LGYGNSHIGAFNEEINVAQAQDLSRRELGFHDRPVIDVCPVGGTAITNSYFVVAQSDFAML
jgi:hypothetical protein